MIKSVELEVGGRNLSLEIGRFAKQADGAVLVKYGETVVLATACVDDGKKEDRGFLPFIVDYRERTFSLPASLTVLSAPFSPKVLEVRRKLL